MKEYKESIDSTSSIKKLKNTICMLILVITCWSSKAYSFTNNKDIVCIVSLPNWISTNTVVKTAFLEEFKRLWWKSFSRKVDICLDENNGGIASFEDKVLDVMKTRKPKLIIAFFNVWENMNEVKGHSTQNSEGTLYGKIYFLFERVKSFFGIEYNNQETLSPTDLVQYFTRINSLGSRSNTGIIFYLSGGKIRFDLFKELSRVVFANMDNVFNLPRKFVLNLESPIVDPVGNHSMPTGTELTRLIFVTAIFRIKSIVDMNN